MPWKQGYIMPTGPDTDSQPCRPRNHPWAWRRDVMDIRGQIFLVGFHGHEGQPKKLKRVHKRHWLACPAPPRAVHGAIFVVILHGLDGKKNIPRYQCFCPYSKCNIVVNRFCIPNQWNIFWVLQSKLTQHRSSRGKVSCQSMIFDCW